MNLQYSAKADQADITKLEKNKMKTEVYLNINQKGFEKFKKEAIEKDKDSMGDDYEDGALYDEMIISDPEFEFDQSTGQLVIYGGLFKEGTEMAFLDVKTEVSLDLALEIVNYYMKKLGKLKTVLEATK